MCKKKTWINIKKKKEKENIEYIKTQKYHHVIPQIWKRKIEDEGELKEAKKQLKISQSMFTKHGGVFFLFSTCF